MAWKQRGGRRYYYRNTKINGRVLSEYIGAGRMAELTAELDAAARAAREAKALAWRKVQHEQDAIDQQISELGDQVAAYIAAELISRGYRQHKRGEWRKQRELSTGSRST